MAVEVIVGEALAVLRAMPDASVHSCVTSPPYWRMRDYGHADQLGLEPDVADFVDRLATIFDEVRRVLRPEGSAWVNLGDCYCRRGGTRRQESGAGRRYTATPGRSSEGLKPGDLVGVPWRFAFEAQRRGWYLRSETIWHKTNPTPDTSSSRPSVAHETVFLLTKQPSPEYYYDRDALRTPLRPKTITSYGTDRRDLGGDELGRVRSHNMAKRMRVRRPALDAEGKPKGATRGTVWSIGVNANRDAVEHYAMQASEVARLCVIGGCPPGGVVLDPFFGVGTTGIQAQRTGRSCIGIELVERYAELARNRIYSDSPLLATELEPSAELDSVEQLELVDS